MSDRGITLHCTVPRYMTKREKPYRSIEDRHSARSERSGNKSQIKLCARRLFGVFSALCLCLAQIAFTQEIPFLEEAKKGNPKAQFDLGKRMMVDGLQEEGVEWITKAAEQGLADAQFYLGEMGIKPRRWYKRAAEQGHVEAIFEVGMTEYKRGNLRVGVKMLARAAAERHAEAMFQLGNISDGDQVREWFRQAAEHGHAEAQFIMGSKYSSGNGGKQDSLEMFRWYHLSAKQGWRPAQIELGQMYMYGMGVTEDPAEAYQWFSLAGEAKFLEFLQSAMLPSEVEAVEMRLDSLQQGFASLKNSQGVQLEFTCSEKGLRMWVRDFPAIAPPGWRLIQFRLDEGEWSQLMVGRVVSLSDEELVLSITGADMAGKQQFVAGMVAKAHFPDSDLLGYLDDSIVDGISDTEFVSPEELAGNPFTVNPPQRWVHEYLEFKVLASPYGETMHTLRWELAGGLRSFLVKCRLIQKLQDLGVKVPNLP